MQAARAEAEQTGCGRRSAPGCRASWRDRSRRAAISLPQTRARRYWRQRRNLPKRADSASDSSPVHQPWWAAPAITRLTTSSTAACASRLPWCVPCCHTRCSSSCRRRRTSEPLRCARRCAPSCSTCFATARRSSRSRSSRCDWASWATPQITRCGFTSRFAWFPCAPPSWTRSSS